MKTLNKEICNKPERKVKVLQFGEGNFLRAFVDWIIQTMNDKQVFDGGVCVVQPMPQGRVDALAAQDGLYTLYLQGLQNGEKVRTHQVIDVLQDFVNPFTDYAKYLDYAKSEDLEFVISNTTEAGIAYDETDTDLTVTPYDTPFEYQQAVYDRQRHPGLCCDSRGRHLFLHVDEAPAGQAERTPLPRNLHHHPGAGFCRHVGLGVH